MDRDRTDPYGFGRRDERPRGDGGDGGRDLKRPRRGYDPSAAPPPSRWDVPPPRHYAAPAPGYAPGYQGGFFGGPRGGPPPGYMYQSGPPGPVPGYGYQAGPPGPFPGYGYQAGPPGPPPGYGYPGGPRGPAGPGYGNAAPRRRPSSEKTGPRPSPHQRLLPVLAEHRQIWLDAFWNDSIRPSQSQLGVSHALNVLGWDHEDELRTEDGLSLDMAQPSTKTAVEFDGPTHYLQGPDGPSLDGRTAFKRRLLGRLGWTCAAVPYFEWDPLLASGATEPYLRGVLARLAPQN